MRFQETRTETGFPELNFESYQLEPDFQISKLDVCVYFLLYICPQPMIEDDQKPIRNQNFGTQPV